MAASVSRWLLHGSPLWYPHLTPRALRYLEPTGTQRRLPSKCRALSAASPRAWRQPPVAAVAAATRRAGVA